MVPVQVIELGCEMQASLTPGPNLLAILLYCLLQRRKKELLASGSLASLSSHCFLSVKWRYGIHLVFKGLLQSLAHMENAM